MTALAEKLKPQFAELSSAERAELASYLLETLDGPANPAAHSAWEIEVARRADEIRSDRAEGRPIAEALSDLRSRHS
jgi:hypothetical protein